LRWEKKLPIWTIWLPTLLMAITCVLNVQMGHASPFKTFKFYKFSNNIRKFSI
jgi:hypothetical protein